MWLSFYSWNRLAFLWLLPACCRAAPCVLSLMEQPSEKSLSLLFLEEFWLPDHVGKSRDNLCREICRMKASGLPWQRAASTLTRLQCVVCLSFLTASVPTRREHISTQTEIWSYQCFSEMSSHIAIQSRLPHPRSQRSRIFVYYLANWFY